MLEGRSGQPTQRRVGHNHFDSHQEGAVPSEELSSERRSDVSDSSRRALGRASSAEVAGAGKERPAGLVVVGVAGQLTVLCWQFFRTSASFVAMNLPMPGT